jgi:hypothetical protein
MWERGVVLDWGGIGLIGDQTMANEIKVKMKTLTPCPTLCKRKAVI